MLQATGFVLIIVFVSILASFKSTSFECGQLASDVQPTVTGGAPAANIEHPWNIALYLKEQKTFLCGGSIISQHAVLTAAHCVTDGNTSQVLSPDQFMIIAGKLHSDFGTVDRFEKRYEVKIIRVHQDYKGGENEYKSDIALLGIKKVIEFTNYIQTVCVNLDPERDNDFQQSLKLLERRKINGTVVGWGSDIANTPQNTLTKGEFPYLSNVKCKDYLEKHQRYTEITAIGDNKFCGIVKDGYTVDPGDSGGGYTIPSKSRHYIIGIVSFKLKKTTDFTIYTDLTQRFLLNWIERKHQEIRNQLNGENKNQFFEQQHQVLLRASS